MVITLLIFSHRKQANKKTIGSKLGGSWVRLTRDAFCLKLYKCFFHIASVPSMITKIIIPNNDLIILKI